MSNMINFNRWTQQDFVTTMLKDVLLHHLKQEKARLCSLQTPIMTICEGETNVSYKGFEAEIFFIDDAISTRVHQIENAFK